MGPTHRYVKYIIPDGLLYVDIITGAIIHSKGTVLMPEEDNIKAEIIFTSNVDL